MFTCSLQLTRWRLIWTCGWNETCPRASQNSEISRGKVPVQSESQILNLHSRKQKLHLHACFQQWQGTEEFLSSQFCVLYLQVDKKKNENQKLVYDMTILCLKKKRGIPNQNLQFMNNVKEQASFSHHFLWVGNNTVVPENLQSEANLLFMVAFSLFT